MRTRDGIWISDGDMWGIDRFAWEDDEDTPPDDEQAEITPEDPRY